MAESLQGAPQPWHGRRVLVTGASGLVGSWLVKAMLDRGAFVVALVRDSDPQSEFFRSGDYRRTSIVNGCVEDYPALERAVNEHEIDSVFHLAAQPIVGVARRSPLQTFEANIRGTYNLLEACRVHRGLVRCVVVASSDKAYGAQPELPYREEMPLLGRQPYEVSKSCADLIAQSYYHSYGTPVTIARCGNIYGGGDLNWSRIVPHTVRALLRGERPLIRSDGTFLRDYLYVKDVVGAYLRLAEQIERPGVAGQPFNFSPETALTVLDVVARIGVLMGRTAILPDVQNTAQGEIHAQYLSAARAHELLGWQPAFSIDDGLRETIAWYQAFLQ